jgi:hypothetical protein
MPLGPELSQFGKKPRADQHGHVNGSGRTIDLTKVPSSSTGRPRWETIAATRTELDERIKTAEAASRTGKCPPNCSVGKDFAGFDYAAFLQDPEIGLFLKELPDGILYRCPFEGEHTGTNASKDGKIQFPNAEHPRHTVKDFHAGCQVLLDGSVFRWSHLFPTRLIDKHCQRYGDGNGTESSKEEPRRKIEFLTISPGTDPKEVLPPAKYVVRLYVKQRATGILYGEPDSGKTTIVVDLVRAVICEQPTWCGQDVLVHGAVAWIAGEWPENFAYMLWGHERETGWKQKHDLYLLPGQVALSNAADVDELVAAVKACPSKVEIIVVDTLSKNFGQGDPDKGVDMQRFLSNCERIAHETDAAVLVIHHTGWDTSRMRGSSVAKGNVPTMLRVEPDALPGGELGAKLTNEKLKSRKKGAKSLFKLVQEEVTAVVHGELTTVEYVVAQWVSPSEIGSGPIDLTQVDELIELDEMTQKVWTALYRNGGRMKVNDLLEAVGLDKKKKQPVRTALTRLAEKGCIEEKVDESDRYKATDYWLTAWGKSPEKWLKGYAPV